jgi:hypothetical protein
LPNLYLIQGIKLSLNFMYKGCRWNILKIVFQTRCDSRIILFIVPMISSQTFSLCGKRKKRKRFNMRLSEFFVSKHLYSYNHHQWRYRPDFALAASKTFTHSCLFSTRLPVPCIRSLYSEADCCLFRFSSLRIFAGWGCQHRAPRPCLLEDHRYCRTLALPHSAHVLRSMLPASPLRGSSESQPEPTSRLNKGHRLTSLVLISER